MADPWQAIHPSTAFHALSALSVDWWVAGGWALDLFVGRQTRPHKDLDIGILRRDFSTVYAALSSWEFFEARRGTLTSLRRGDEPRADVNSLWCRPANAASWTLELMLDECDGGCWVFRRQRSVHRPLAMVMRRTGDGVPYLAPEIQLLYKARPVREQDQADFDQVAPRLDAAARSWLREALAKVHPGHLWLRAL